MDLKTTDVLKLVNWTNCYQISCLLLCSCITATAPFTESYVKLFSYTTSFVALIINDIWKKILLLDMHGECLNLLVN